MRRINPVLVALGADEGEAFNPQIVAIEGDNLIVATLMARGQRVSDV